jgi:hypothetical protein
MPDGRYFVVRGRLWRCSDPRLNADEKAALVRELMLARRAKWEAMRTLDASAQEVARQRVDAAKLALGERGPPWWTDGAPDCNRHLARTTHYASWYKGIIALAESQPEGYSARPGPCQIGYSAEEASRHRNSCHAGRLRPA